MALFTAGIVLLLNIWGGKRSGLTTDPSKEMADVHKCMKMLKALEVKYVYCTCLIDVVPISYHHPIGGTQLAAYGKRSVVAKSVHRILLWI